MRYRRDIIDKRSKGAKEALQTDELIILVKTVAKALQNPVEVPEVMGGPCHSLPPCVPGKRGGEHC